MQISYLIPTLNSGSDRIEDNSEVQGLWMLPSVGNFMSKNFTISLVKLDYVFDGMW